MNVVFHVTTAVAVMGTVASFDEKSDSFSNRLCPILGVFFLGVMVHGLLDYMPHQYPFSASIDCMVALLFVLLLILKSSKNTRLFVAFAFFGSVFPDIVDLLPAMLNKYLNLQLPLINKVFPWHYPEYSGSIFSTQFNIVSAINHVLVVLATILVCWFRRDNLKIIFNL